MSVKRKINSENRVYQTRWESDYLIITNNNKIQCLVCFQTIAVPKEYNCKRHYQTKHEEKYKAYVGEAREEIIRNLKRKIKQQTNVFNKIPESQKSALHASYAVALQLAKNNKPMSDGIMVKQCAIEMAKAFGDHKMAQHFETVALSSQTVQRRIVDMGEQVEKSVVDSIKKCVHFSICLDESTDQTDVSQLLIFIRFTQEDFITREELLDILPLHGTTRGIDIFEALQKTFEKVGGFEKCTCIVTDGAPSMTGPNIGLMGLLRKNGLTFPGLHCIIHQGALCGKSVKQNETFKLVVKIINMIRGGNKALLHRQLKQFLEDMDSEYGDLLLYNNVRWLSAGKCLERFFAIRKELPTFLQQFVSADTLQMERKLQSLEFLKELAFLTDFTNHLNDLNLKMQGKDKLITDLVGCINGFRSKLKIFASTIGINSLVHFKSCQKIVEDFPDENVDFSEFQKNVKDVQDEFDKRFRDFEEIKKDISLFSNPMSAKTEEQDLAYQMELCELQADAFYQTVQLRGPDFFKLLPRDRFPNLRQFGLKVTSMFGSTYICESVFSSMKHIKNNIRNRLSDTSLQHLIRLSTTATGVNFHSLVEQAQNPQHSH